MPRSAASLSEKDIPLDLTLTIFDELETMLDDEADDCLMLLIDCFVTFDEDDEVDDELNEEDAEKLLENELLDFWAATEESAAVDFVNSDIVIVLN